jgi:crossover junction endodeoxyribonuclease RuvC
MGIDPGTLITGYGIIEFAGDKTRLIVSDAIINKNQKPMAMRLEAIYNKLSEVIKSFSPDEIAIETAFYGKNAQSALKLGQARGVALLAAVKNKKSITEYSPREVKKSVVGNGAASKEQVQYMVKSLLKMRKVPKYYDTTDALAVAICHSFHMSSGTRSKSGKYRDWKSFIQVNPTIVKK